jgi:hypothetical protein
MSPMSVAIFGAWFAFTWFCLQCSWTLDAFPKLGLDMNLRPLSFRPRSGGAGEQVAATRQIVPDYHVLLHISMLSNDLQGVKLLCVQRPFVHNISKGRQAGCTRPGSCWRSIRRRRRVLSSQTSTKSFKWRSTPVVFRSSCNISQHFSASDKTEKWWVLPKPHHSTIVGKVKMRDSFFSCKIAYSSLYTSIRF